MSTLNFNELNSTFRKLIGDENASLYRFQEEVAAQLLTGDKNLILRAPTGSGKTWAALLPYLYARKYNLLFVDKVLYALPLRSLASQLYQSTANACKKVAAELDTITVKIQTGEQQDDPFFQGDIVFTTIDQLLSSYLLSPVSLPRRLANINAGALLGSLVVFDEFHLLDPDRSMGTAIEMLERLSGLCRFVLMTATLSDEAVSYLGKHLNDTVVVDLSGTEIEAIEKRKDEPTIRFWRYHDKPMTAEDVLDQNCEGRRLVLTNTVNRAQQIYQQINDLLSKRQSPTEAILLHSRFFPRDRNTKEMRINERLGKASRRQKINFVLVSTQVVEAGMDFSVDHLHSELAPINSLIQRAGRCARYGGKGTVNIYPVENNRPYEISMEETAAYLTHRSGTVFAYDHEREAVNLVLGGHEQRVLAQYDSMLRRRNRVSLSMDGLLPGVRDELIRDINSVSVLLTATPEKIYFDKSGGAPEMFSVPLGTLYGFLAKSAAVSGEQWVAKIPVADQAEDDETRVYRFKWQLLDQKMLPAAWMVALNPAFTRYTCDLGLQLGEAGLDIPITYNKRRRALRYSYRRETFAEHVRLVLKQNKQLMLRARHAVVLLAAELGITIEDIDRAVRYAIIFHDVGKLSIGWQDAAKKWQLDKDPGTAQLEPLAHTDFDPGKDWESQRAPPRRPNHAVEGAYAVYNNLNRVFDGKPEAAACIYTAIARHHTSHGAKLGHFCLIPSANAEVNGLLREAGFPPADTLLDEPDPLTCGARGEFAGELLQASRDEDLPWLPLYFFVVRQLRLADQAGSAEGGKR